jgi:hypothetical protein
MERNCTDQDLVRVVSAVQDRNFSIREERKVYGVAFNTIRRRVSGYVDIDRKRLGPKLFLGDRLREINSRCSHRLGKNRAWFESQRNSTVGWETNSKRETEVSKNALPSKLWYKMFTMRHNLTLQQPESRSVARNTVAREKTKK